MYSNIFVDYRKSEINLWEYEDGHKVHKRLPAPLFFFLKDKLLKNPEYKTIFGDPARKIETDTIYAYKKKIERLKASGMELFESDIPLETKFIVSHYLGQELTIPDFDIWLLDIEVHSEKGFPKPEDANFPITIITVWSTKQQKYFIFAERDFNTSFLDEANEKYEKTIISNENELLNQFMTFVRNSHPDFLSGWNSNFFDIPYIVNRINKIFHEDAASDISPIGVVKEIETTLKNGKIKKTYSIAGISCIDMLEVFKTYTFSARPSWKLDSIAEEELGERKLEYTGTLVDLYNNDWQKYVEYNVHDVRLLKKLEAKKKFLNILFSFCYGCRVPFEFYQKTVRVLDGAFLSELSKKNIVLPDVKRDIEPKKFPGGYVKDPIKGLHEWTVSFDATSLYPSIMMGWNISPETKIGRVDGQYVPDLRKLISGKDIDDYLVTFSGIETSIRELAKLIKEKNFCLAGNGAIYRQDTKGIIPTFVEEWFNKRTTYKKLMYKAEKEGNSSDYARYDALQLNHKILINSVYGFVSTPYSRFYDLDNAMAVTLTGQSITKTVGDTVDSYFASKFSGSELATRYNAHNIENVAIYCDTDSVGSNSLIRVGDNDIKIKDLFKDIYDDINNEVKFKSGNKTYVYPKNLELPFFDETQKEIKLGKVNFIYKHMVKKKMYRVKTKSGKFIEITEDHSCMILDDMDKLMEVKPKNIKDGDRTVAMLMNLTHGIDEVVSVEFIGEEFTDVYDVGMADTPHTFFANDILVHNSLYINIGKILDSMKIEERASTSPEKMAPVIEVINTEIVPFVSNIINRSMDALSLSRYNCKENKISFKVEKVSRRSFFLEKKKYIMWVVYDGESKMAVDKLKATGIELVRSSTPKLAKKHMKDCLFDMLKTTNRELIISKLKDVRSKFLVADIDDIAFPSTANNLKKYLDSFNEKGKFHRTPIHIRGSILYNDVLLENEDLRTKYDLIYEGDKIKLIHTKTGRDWNSNVISYKEKWISELNIEEYVDREHQFEKAFFNPLSKFFNLLNWEVPKLNESEIEAHFNWG